MSRTETPDTDADAQIRGILDLERLVGFTVVAGAGSGKTTSLVKALSHLTRTRGPALRERTQRVACITYTEVAAQEIHDDIGNDSLAVVSTIHGFLWSIVNPFQKEIGRWLELLLEEQIEALIFKQGSYKSGTHQSTKDKDAATLEKKQRQLAAAKHIDRWTYGIGGNYSRGVLGHEDIAKMVPAMIVDRPLLARLVARQFPFILVDESQDTFPTVVDALKKAWTLAEGTMCLGFFGDPMQQIYPRGIVSVELESTWISVDKPENFRSSRKVLACVNAVRAGGDSLHQITGLANQDEGEAFLFVLPASNDRSKHLDQVRYWLDENSVSGNWSRNAGDGGSKVLMIMHRMAAIRLGFERLHAAFTDNGAGGLEQAFNEGNAWPLAPFKDVIVPLCSADRASSPAVLSILRGHCPLLRSGREESRLKLTLRSIKAAVEELRLKAEGRAKLGDLLSLAAVRELIDLDPRMAAYLNPDGEHGDVALDEKTLAVLNAMCECDLSELEGYYRYVTQESAYSTQHGTKGSEFDRVIVVLDDEEGKRYTSYSYEKLLGLKDLSKKDNENLALGVDSVIDRTRRLFYVSVSRARCAVAIVIFSSDVGKALEVLRMSAIGQHLQILTLGDLEPAAMDEYDPEELRLW